MNPPDQNLRPDRLLWTRLVIIGLTAALLAAASLYFVSNAQSAGAERELEAFRTSTIEQAQKARADSTPPGSMLGFLKFSPEQRERLGVLERRYQLLLYRRGLAEGFVTRGSILLLALGAFYILAARRDSDRKPQLGGAQAAQP